MKVLRFLLAFVLAFAILSPIASANIGNSAKPVYYVALGDSLAHGVLSDNTLGSGYADFIADILDENNKLAGYNKGFAFLRYKTTNIISDLETNVKKPINFSTEDEVVAIQSEIKKANIITLSIGANDVLSNVGREGDKLIYDMATVTAGIADTKANIDKILKKIKSINPKVDVYVMGYYNPYPYIGDQVTLAMLVASLDAAVKGVTEANDYVFVPVNKVVGSKREEFMPNPNNIHPSEAGYKAIADEFYVYMKEYLDLVPLPQIVDVPTFKDVKDATTAEFVGKAATYGIMKGYSDNTFKPNGKLTRAQVTSILARALDLTESKKPSYTDISKLAATTIAEIEAAYAAGLILDGKTFKPNESITRLEVAQMIDRAYTYKTGSAYKATNNAPFSDTKNLNATQQRAVALVYDYKIATGGGGKFSPNGVVTRSQAAKMFVTFIEAIQ